MNEAAVSRKVIAYLNDECGAKFYKASDRFHASVPDIIGAHECRHIVIETKIHPRKPTGLQKHELEEYARHSAGSFVLTYHKTKKTYLVECWITGEAETFSNHKDAALWLLKQSYSNTKRKR